ncbi:CBS domain-containing protein [Salinimicrobium sp. MT39]|uniref:CBS domain-containing protein n=1 Tax=Salinimicrobium profundisediminis TaxID=2994553 RepID=A0A9X3CVU5_9FLAO|nr:CBS domain-containing protein [Salinimicrobium profundisediminis]MCX2837822.1 CBS domain-containing protein [Salinimicrobium profundisediminis]
MKNDISVSQIMTKNILRLSLSDSLSTAESLMKKNHIRHLPVVENEHIVGMISLNDLLRISFADATDGGGDDVETTVYEMFTVEQVMTQKVEYITSSHTVTDVAKLFLEHEFHALPVVDDDCLTGIVTTTDVIRFFLENKSKE